MEKFLFYAMTGEKMCFQHILLNALDLHMSGYEVQIIFEGASVKLLPQFVKEKHPLFLKAKEKGLIAGVCLTCSKALNVYEENKKSGVEFLDDMSGHAGIKPFVAEGYNVISM